MGKGVGVIVGEGNLVEVGRGETVTEGIVVEVGIGVLVGGTGVFDGWVGVGVGVKVDVGEIPEILMELLTKTLL